MCTNALARIRISATCNPDLSSHAMASKDSISRSSAPTRRREPRKDTVASDVLEKDDTELRLEKALFGDDAGFLKSLIAQRWGEDRELQRVGSGSEPTSGIEAEEEDLADVPDEDLFFLDAGTGELPAAVTRDLEKERQQDPHESRRPVWYDSDDDKLTVSLASNTRLRKLRDTEDDDVVTGREYIRRLRRQYERLHPTPEWVTYARKKRRTSNGAQRSGSDADSDVSMDDDDSVPSVKPLSELLRSAGSLTRTDASTSNKPRKLRPEVIDIQRTKDIVTSSPSSIDTLQFHPHYPLLLTAGPSSTVSLYHVSPHPPHPNPLLTSLHITKTPLHTAAFCTPPTASYENGSETEQTRIFLSSRRRYFHTWSLSTGIITKVSRALTSFRHEQRTTESFKLSPCGRYMGLISSSRKGGGSINVLSTESMQWLCSCRVDSAGGIADFDWWCDGEGFVVAGKNGEISEYSIPEKRIVARWWDEGAVGTTVIAVGGDGTSTRWVAVGSSSGIVNIYDRRSPAFSAIFKENATSKPASTSAGSNRPTPTKTLSHLTTPISHLVFSPDSQMLLMSSRWKKNALRLVHLPSCTVYRNWPTDKTPLGRVSSVAISRDGGWLAVGSEGGKVRLWEIRE